ncbi:MAG: hypothetical protein P8018_01150, partial [Acidobacteriota bacterium]
YSAHLTDMRAVYQFSARTFIRAIVQHTDYTFDPSLYPYPIEAHSKHILGQFLYSYKLNPQTALYIGYSDQYLGHPKAGLTQTDRSVFMKIAYAWVR